MEEANLRENFMKIGYLRDRILKYFTDIEDETVSVSVTNKAVLDKISETIQEFIKRVGEIRDIQDYVDIPFKMKDSNGEIIFRPFTERELTDLYQLWQEDCSTFETQFEMYVYSYALERKASSIARSYNTKSAGQPMTPEDAYKILELTVLSDMHLFIFHRSFLRRLVYSVVPGVTIKRTLDSLLLDYHPVSPANLEEKQRLMKNLELYEVFSRGFYNPFDDGDSSDRKADSESIYENPEEDDDVTKPLSAKDIKSIRTWNHDTPAKAIYRDHKMYAGKYFAPGDVIERCPIKFMSEKDLYSENIRDNVFPIDTERGVYGFPLGNALCYRNSDEASTEGNMDYMYDTDTDCLVFTAVTRIKKGDELILQVTSQDYANTLKPNQFKYYDDFGSANRTKNIHIA